MPERKDRTLTVMPRILLRGKTVDLSLTLNNIADGEYGMRIFPVSYSAKEYDDIIPVIFNGGKLQLTFCPTKEQEYSLILYRGEEWIAESAIYALEHDLYALNPYKGDFHIHSNRSDGCEPPAEVAAQGRAIGLDIMAVTDHGQYPPSLEAMSAYENVTLDLLICPGEEVHPPNNPIHIINFGGSSSVNDLFDTPQYSQEVAEIQANLPELKDGCDPYEYASSKWVFEKIKEFEGMSIFCHPYWRFPYFGAPQVYYISEGLTSQVFNDRPFDAYEILGGYNLNDQDSNILQAARYHEERLNGPLPIVGVSDAHGCYNELFGWYFTIIFAPSCTFNNITEGIKSCMSVAVEKLPNREHRVYGPMRLASYALFLLKNYFPEHDALCSVEGQLMMDWLNGDTSAADKLLGLSGQTTEWQNECFGR